MEYCPYCENAKRLLASKSIPYKEIKVSLDDEPEWDRLEKLTGYKTMPQIFIDEHFVGGYRELTAIEQSGELDKLLSSS